LRPPKVCVASGSLGSRGTDQRQGCRLSPLSGARWSPAPASSSGAKSTTPGRTDVLLHHA
jgi:hypothetical protein